MKLAVIGSTGLVGREILKVLKEFNLTDNILLSASDKSVGKTVNCNGEQSKIMSIDDVHYQKPDIAIFSAGSKVSKEWAEKFAKSGIWVIDNSSAWRMNNDVPLVVPEVNIDTITENTKIIANPNCSTIQMIVVLAPLHRINKIKRITISTYQSVSGTGAEAVEQLYAEREQRPVKKVYPYTIDLNCFPHGGNFLDNAYTTEEMKLVNETHKILNDYNIEIAATVVRIPVIVGHSESISLEFENDIDADEVRDILKNAEGVVINDNPAKNYYPMPLDAKGKNEVFVGRIRNDLFKNNCIHLWVVADNLRKGAATNAVQIAKYLKERYYK